jgi:integrase/recombinase XerD
VDSAELRGQTAEANSVRDMVQETAKLWSKHHLTYDQTKHVVKQVRHVLQLTVPTARRRTVDRLDRPQVERLIAAAIAKRSPTAI